MVFPRQEHWSGLPFPSPGDLLHPGREPASPALQADSLPLSHQGNPDIPTPAFKLLVKVRWGKVLEKVLSRWNDFLSSSLFPPFYCFLFSLKYSLNRCKIPSTMTIRCDAKMRDTQSLPSRNCQSGWGLQIGLKTIHWCINSAKIDIMKIALRKAWLIQEGEWDS